MAMDLRQMVKNALLEFSANIEKYAGAKVRKEVIRDGETLPEVFDAAKGALDYKDALDRLDKLADKPTRNKIMGDCGRACQSLFDQESLKAKELRQTYATEEAFLNDFKAFDNGTRIERKGNDLIQSFKPGDFFPHLPQLRCACMLIGGLPKGVCASPTACECSRAFTRQRWETILGRPVDVEIVETPIINDSEECVCIIHL
ncbi:MAG: hypothetical protein PHG51_07375 [Candidatus Omnitrophica bacterium]|nr:hypothetical protein [Candidatus Omnitrophota bacterium]